MASTSARKPIDSGSDGTPSSAGGLSTKELLTAALQARITSNNYIAHLKIWEVVNDGPGGAPQRKARYLILAVQRDSGRVTINKAKRNANGTFSIGKDWDLNQLREIVVDQPDTFTLTLSRSYSWQTERAREQTQFLQTIVKVFRKYTGEDGPHCVGLDPQPSTNGSSSQQTPSRQSSKDDPRSLPQIDTAVRKERSRESPQKQTSAGPRSAAHDGFYDPVSRQGAPQSSPEKAERTQSGIPSISTSFADERSINTPQRRPTMERQASAMAVMTPTVESVESAMGNLSVGSSLPRSTSQGNSPNTATSSLPLIETPPGAGSVDSSAKVARSPSRIGAKLAAVMDRAATPTRKEPSRSATPTNAVAPEQQVVKAAPAIVPPPRRPPQARRRTSDRYSASTLTPNTGGDARARLSSIEPDRGGAAYEKMLLAGTGLSGVAEGDDDDDEEEEDVDPYGGAEISEINDVADILPRSASVRKRRKSQKVDVKDAKMANVNAAQDEDEDNTLQYVEEMLEGFDFRRNANGLNARFASDRAASRSGALVGKGTADIIEARLLDELEALDAANIHAIIESDDRVNLVVQHMEQALHELDVIDSMIAGFKVQLNARAEDIYHIESQNRGLQVQTSNQRALSVEIEKLLSTVHVDESAIGLLLNATFVSDEDIGELEAAGSALYKAMLQARRTKEDSQHGDPSAAGMAAATERLDEYNALADRFAKRLLKYLSDLFNEQTYNITHDNRRVKALNPPTPTMTDHSAVEAVLGRYCGLLLYAKEVSPAYFTRISAAYFASASDRYKNEMSKLFSVCKGQIARVSDEEVNEATLIPPSAASASSALRSGTIRRGGRDRGGKGSKLAPGEMSGSEAFTRILTCITPIVTREQNFISDLLHINNNAITFADYMDLEAYFRRRAALVYGGGPSGVTGMVKSMREALDLIFGFLAPEWQGLVDHVIGRDKTQVVGILAALDRGMLEADEVNNEFLLRHLSKLQMKLASQLENFIAEQIRGIDQTKLTARKRKGVVHFIKAFPIFVDRIEGQLVNAESLQIRAVIDHYYEQICSRMFDVLQTMAIPKMEGGTFSSSNTDEDKGQLNHHVILIENMFHITKGITRVQTMRNTVALQAQLKRAQNILDDALHAYVQSVLRRSLGKMIDFGDGIDSLLRNTPANEVSLHSTYSRQAAKRLVKEYNSKDLRKAVEALARRVQKHFDEDEITTLVSHDAGPAGGGGSNVYDASGISADEIIEVLSTVWRHLEDGFTSECERLIRILRECYTTNDSKLLAEYTIEDARRPFASNSPAGRRR